MQIIFNNFRINLYLIKQNQYNHLKSFFYVRTIENNIFSRAYFTDLYYIIYIHTVMIIFYNMYSYFLLPLKNYTHYLTLYILYDCKSIIK